MVRIKLGIRELKARLGTYPRQVKAGSTATIAERGQPIGRIVPLAQPIETRLQAVRQAGLIAWSRQRDCVPEDTPSEGLIEPPCSWPRRGELLRPPERHT